jgi:hypothetical protein
VNQNAQYLKVLSIFHFVVAAITALVACFPILHFLVGLWLFAGSLMPGAFGESATPPFPVPLSGLFFMAIAGTFILTGWAFAVCQALNGYFLLTRKRHMFCLIVAGIECAFPPLSTVLGVFTVVLLLQPAVREMFGVSQPVAG